MKTTLMAAASALVLSAVAASAAPAVIQSPVNVRTGPGTQYQVVATLPGGAAVDVGGCTAGWCAINWNGGTGYVNAGYLQTAGGPGPVAISPGYDDPDYGTYADSDDYYGPDYNGPGIYGPGIGLRNHRQFDGRQRGPGRPAMTARPSGPQPGFTSPARNFGINQGAPRMSAPVGLRTGGPSMGMRGPSMGARGPSMGAHIGGPGGRR